MGYRVFVQRDEPGIDVAGISRNARQHFGAEVAAEPPAEPAAAHEPLPVRARLSLTRSDGLSGAVDLVARRSTVDDWAEARRAETRGRAAGMGDLAARCGTLWELEPDPSTPEVVVLTLCAALAATALGPVLPPDGSTLFGVRGAVQRAERLQRERA